MVPTDEKSMTIMVGNMVAGRHGTGAFDPQAQGRARGESGQTKLTPSHTSPPMRPYLLILPEQFHQLGTKNSNI